MPRKNSRVGRPKQRGRYAAERHIGVAPKKQQPRVELEKLIMPDGQCTFHLKRPKARFATKEKANAALRQAQQQRARVGSAYAEKRVYECPDGGCGGWHLSSREAFDVRPWQER